MNTNNIDVAWELYQGMGLVGFTILLAFLKLNNAPGAWNMANGFRSLYNDGPL